MNKRYNDAPVPQIKIDMINNMLASIEVFYAYKAWSEMGRDYTTYNAREKAWNDYCRARDLKLGLKPLNQQPEQTTYRIRMQ